MGKPKFSKKKYETPSHPWKEERIKKEDELVRKYGLKNKREVWKSETRLRKYRGEARRLLARADSDDRQSIKEIDQLLVHLTRMNILPPNSNLDDVLALDSEKILSRRLQTQVYLKGLSRTPKQARQLIIHGHVAVDGKKVTVPNYMVEKNEEDNISYTGNSPLNIPMHPERPQPKFQPASKPFDKSEDKPIEKIEEKQKIEKPEEIKEKKVVEEKPKMDSKEEIKETELKEKTIDSEKIEESKKTDETKKSEIEKVESEKNEKNEEKNDEGGK